MKRCWCPWRARRANLKLAKRNIGADNPEFGVGGTRDVYVDEGVASRAREVLEVPQFSDAELAQLSEQAGREASEAP